MLKYVIHYNSTIIAARSKRRCAACANEFNLKVGFSMESSSDKIGLIHASTSAIIFPSSQYFPLVIVRSMPLIDHAIAIDPLSSATYTMIIFHDILSISANNLRSQQEPEFSFKARETFALFVLRQCVHLPRSLSDHKQNSYTISMIETRIYRLKM